LDPSFIGTHSLRRTKATLTYRRTGNLRAVQLLLGHTKIESTVRYLGIEIDDALAIAEQVDVGNTRAEQTCPARQFMAGACQNRPSAAGGKERVWPSRTVSRDTEVHDAHAGAACECSGHRFDFTPPGWSKDCA
jgi:hypothetical protein